MIYIADISEILLELGLSSTVTDEERAVSIASLRRAEGAVRRYLQYDPCYGEHTEYYPRQSSQIMGGQLVWEVTDTEAVQRRLAEAATSELQVQHLPIRSITSLYIDYDGRSGAREGSFAVSTLKVEGTDYWPNYDGVDSSSVSFCRDGIIRALGSWPTTPGCVKVTYMAGYAADELRGQDSVLDASPIHEAVLYDAARRVRRMFASKKHASAGWIAGILTSERMGDYNYTISPQASDHLIGPGELSDETKAMLESFANYGIALGS